MSQTFAIAVQSVTLPDGSTLDFRVNPADSALCEIHLVGRSPAHSGAEGTHILTFKRNGGPSDVSFSPAPAGGETQAYREMQAREAQRIEDEKQAYANDPAREFRSHPSVDKDAVRRYDPVTGRSLDGDSVSYDDEGNPLSKKSRAAHDNDNDPDMSFPVKTSPVHGKINTAGTDGLPVKPKEGTLADTPLQDRKDHASVGLQPTPRG